MPTIGYLEGVDPLILTRLSVRGTGTLPIGNGFDNHGKFITNITERDRIDVVIGHLHKILRTQHQGFLPLDLLQSCLDCQIPILIIVPQQDQPAARQMLGEVSDKITLVDPEQVYNELTHLLALP
jgi:hypothetical protein